MANSLEIPELHVEGVHDKHAIIHLLKRHGYLGDENQREINIVNQEGDLEVLKTMPLAIPAASHRSVGFVLDIDRELSDRWKQITTILSRQGLNPPPMPNPEGYIEHHADWDARVGVWLMPDNQTNLGKLEHFMQTLVPEGDILWPYAETATDKAKAEFQARFSEPDRVKAMIHSWLAWQKEPGLSFGTSIKTHYFKHDSEVAMRFLAWIRKLYGLT